MVRHEGELLAESRGMRVFCASRPELFATEEVLAPDALRSASPTCASAVKRYSVVPPEYPQKHPRDFLNLINNRWRQQRQRQQRALLHNNRSNHKDNTRRSIQRTY